MRLSWRIVICLAVAKTRDPLVTMASAVRAAAGDEVGQAGHLPQINNLKNLEAKNIEAQGEEEDQFEEEIEVLEEELVQEIRDNITYLTCLLIKSMYRYIGKFE